MADRAATRARVAVVSACWGALVASACVPGVKPYPARAQVKDGPGAARHEPRAAERLLAPERALERPGPAPKGHTWRAGYYHYDGTAYVWVPGSWQPTAPGTHWPAFTR